MAYKLEHSAEEQRKLLSSTLQKWSNCQPDIYLISTEGHKIYTQRALLGLNSKFIDELLTRTPRAEFGDLPGISVPASSGCLVNLLKILSTGVAIADNKSHLLEAATAAEYIGIRLENCQIGFKKKRIGESRETSNDASSKRKIPAAAVPKNAKISKVDVDECDSTVKQEAKDYDEIRTNIEENIVNQKAEAIKKYSCEQCEKAFTTKQAKLRHAMIHTDNPTPFACDQCDKRFDRKYRLDKHKTFHACVGVEAVEVAPDVPAYSEQIDQSEASQIEIEGEASMLVEVHHVTSPETKEKAQEESLEPESDSVQADDENRSYNADLESNSNESENIHDSMVKEKLLADRQKLLEELNSFEGQEGTLDFLN